MEAFGAALLIIVGSMVTGRAICVVAGGRQQWWGSPAVGFAALIILAAAAIKLPGRAVTAAILLLVLVLLAVVILVRARAWPWSAVEITAGLVSLLGASIPFVANGRVGLAGVGFDDDTSTFLLYTETLRSARMEALWPPGNGYPLGPPSVAAVVSSVTGMSLEMAFCGLFLAVVALAAMTAAGVLRGGAPWRAVVIGVLSALAYLAAGYYAEGSFKETIMGLLLLAFVVMLDQARALPDGPTVSRYARALMGPLLLLAAAIYTYSYIAVVWFGATVAVWLVAEALSRPGRIHDLHAWLDRDRALQIATWVVVGLLALIVLVAPIEAQITSFFSSVGVSAGGSAIPVGTLGNLLHTLSGYEALGVWWSPDFRLAPHDAFHAGELSAFALAVLAFAIVWSVRRRDLLLPAAVVACLVIWWRADGAAHPYVAAKALVIAAPLVVALDLRALLGINIRDRLGRWAALVVAVAFCAAAGYSSYSVLRNSPVAAPAEAKEMAAFSRQIGDAPVLYLGSDPYAPWELRDAAVSTLDPNVLSQGAATRQGASTGLGLLDFASVNPTDLDHFAYVITSNTPYASQPPPNFHLIARRPLYELWRRTGPTPYRQALDSSQPGTVLDCTTRAARQLTRHTGVAGVSPKPVVFPGISLAPGDSAASSLTLPRGRWELSIEYISSFSLHLSAQGKDWTMPARLGSTAAQFFAVGQVDSRGITSPIVLTGSLPRPSPITTADLDYASYPEIAATRVPSATHTVPLRRACGRYVEWFHVS